MQPRTLVQRQHLLARQGKRRAQPPVERIGVGNDRVQAIVPTLQFDENEDAREVRIGARPWRLQQRAGCRRAEALEETPPVHRNW